MSRLTINTNIASLNAQRNFTTATKKLSESYTRLSSGLRINRAVDDAAGLSISESLKADTRLFNQGIRNLNDGISLLSIADGALGELGNISIRLSELAEQSANGTLGNKQRIALDQEAQALSKEYNRIARSTEFNGRKLFDGDFGDLILAAGGGRETLIVEDLGGAIGNGTFSEPNSTLVNVASNLTSAVFSDFNNDGFQDFASADYNLGKLWLALGNGDGTFKSLTSSLGVAQPLGLTARDINNDGIEDLIAANQITNDASVFLGRGDGTFNQVQSYTLQAAAQELDIGDVNGDGSLDIVTSTATGISIIHGNGDGSFRAASTINFGITVSDLDLADLDNDGRLDIVGTAYGTSAFYVFKNLGNGTFSPISTYNTNYGNKSVLKDFNNDGIVDIVSSGNATTTYFGNGDGSFGSLSSYAIAGYHMSSNDINGDGLSDLLIGNPFAGTKYNTLLGNSNGTFAHGISFGNSSAIGTLVDINTDGIIDIGGSTVTGFEIFLGNSNSGVSALNPFSLKTQSEALDSISYLRQNLGRLTKQRGHIGAFQSRVETATNNLKQSSLAYSEATSRITDADIAEESSKLTANQIVQQATASVLAQANLQPRLVLQLLGGL